MAWRQASSLPGRFGKLESLPPRENRQRRQSKRVQVPPTIASLLGDRRLGRGKKLNRKNQPPERTAPRPVVNRLRHPEFLNVGEPMQRTHVVCLALALAFALSASDLFARGPGAAPPPLPPGEVVVPVVPPGPPVHGLTLCEFAA